MWLSSCHSKPHGRIKFNRVANSESENPSNAEFVEYPNLEKSAPGANDFPNNWQNYDCMLLINQ